MRTQFIRLGVTTHGCCVGYKKTRIYSIWASMISRCYNVHDSSYHNYGARGVTVCREWKGDFDKFREWAELNGYQNNLSIDRFPDNHGNYSPENCRWVNIAIQNRNKRTNVFITAFGETKCLTDWSNDIRCKVTTSGLKIRLSYNWTPEDAISRNRMNSGFSKKIL